MTNRTPAHGIQRFLCQRGDVRPRVVPAERRNQLETGDTMHYINPPRRLIGTAVLACAAALIPVAALAASTPSAAPAARTPASATSGLVIWQSDGNGAMYHTDYTLNFTNLSGMRARSAVPPGSPRSA
jgi:hypothetical protein